MAAFNGKIIIKHWMLGVFLEIFKIWCIDSWSILTGAATGNGGLMCTGGKHPIIFSFGFQPSVWWCRISQPSTVDLTKIRFDRQNSGESAMDFSFASNGQPEEAMSIWAFNHSCIILYDAIPRLKMSQIWFNSIRCWANSIDSNLRLSQVRGASPMPQGISDAKKRVPRILEEFSM